MQANDHKLSAVARRRLLQEVASTSTSSIAPSPTRKPETDPTENAPKHEIARVAEDEPPNGDTTAANQFSTLVEASAVEFSSSREVEQVSDRSAKIRLSRGQKCVVVGTYVLWVKQGSISIYGAVLSASTAIYRIYAPRIFAVPIIQATTTNAELQLESLNDGIDTLPFIGIKDMWCPAGVKASASSFHVLGHSFEQDPKADRRLTELDTYPWKALLAELGDFDSTSPPRILICGRRTSGVSVLVRCIINRLLAKQVVMSGTSSKKGVVVLDFDTAVPQFVPPGMISLVHVHDPVLGPPLTNILPLAGSAAGQVLKMHFLGEILETDLDDWHLSRVYDLLDLQKILRTEHQQFPEIVILPIWFSDMNQDTARILWNKVQSSDLVCPDSIDTTSEPWRSLAQEGNCRIRRFPVQVLDRITAVREHDLQTQAYFHKENARVVRPFWNETPVLMTSRLTTELSYGDHHSQICAIILWGGRVALEDTYEAICGSLVALVAVQASGYLIDEDGGLDIDSVDHDRTNAASEIQWTEEGLPRGQNLPVLHSNFPFAAKESFCLGLGLVQSISILDRTITLIAAPDLQAQNIVKQDYRIALVVSRATADGRFTTEWAQREMGVTKGGR